MSKKILLLFFISILGIGKIFSQSEAKGIVVDKETMEPLVGIIIYSESNKKGSVTELDGSFSIKLSSLSDKLTFKHVGYKEMKLAASSNMGTIEMETDAIGLKDVVVSSSLAIRRKTPVAISIIEPEMIEAKMSNQEFPEILETTPGVYATKQGGGFGDSRVNVRGFESPNVAVMINGIPMNDMEWGGVYWSNWGGLTDVARNIQIQRGLGASKVSAPSIGGSINVVTRTTDAKKGGSVGYTLGNDGYNKLLATVSTGLTDKGWAMTFLGSKTTGDGYIMGTEGESYTWFVNVSKRLNDQHQLSLTAFGATQWHNQRYNGDYLLITDWEKLKDGYQFNPVYGFDGSGQRVNPNRNQYHKPQIQLNHYWEVNSKSSLSTSLYLSLGSGSGLSWRGSYNDLYGTYSAPAQLPDGSYTLLNQSYRNLDNYRDLSGLKEENASGVNGARAVLTESRNNHIWTGLLSTFTTKLTDQIDLYGGLDLRYYEGLHDARITDLMGGKFFIDPSRAQIKTENMPNITDAYKNEKLKVGDIVYRDNTGYVVQEGVFTQVEYNKEALSVFAAGSLSNNTYWKVDRFYYEEGNQKSEVKNFLGYTAKGGANYNLTSQHNVFANIGFMSRAPFMSGGYFNSIHTSNTVNEDAVNEKSFSTELGYGFRSRALTANLNGYYTKWIDKTMIRSFGSSGNETFVNLTGVNAVHMGVELEMVYKPVRNLDINLMLSFGDWTWDSNAKGYGYNKMGQPIGINGEAVDKDGNAIIEHSSNHAYIEANLKGVKVGNSAQTICSFGFKYKLIESLSIGSDVIYHDNNYANFNIAANSGKTDYYTPWKIPAYAKWNLNAVYRFKMAGFNASLIGNINNVLDQAYIADAKDFTVTSDKPKDWRKDVGVMYGFGRTYTISLKANF